MKSQTNVARELTLAKSLLQQPSELVLRHLERLVRIYRLSLSQGDITYLDPCWYVTHSGLLKLAERRHCAGIHVRPILKSCDPANSRWVFRAAVYKSRSCKGFVGYGDADPSNVSPLVRGAEMRVAETRAASRLRSLSGIWPNRPRRIGVLCCLSSIAMETRKLVPRETPHRRTARG
jgi:hypothetical protein